MGIKKDALELLVKLYNNKVDGIDFDIDKIFLDMGFSKTRFMNAFDYLKDRNLIHRDHSAIGETQEGLPNIQNATISSLGIDAIEEENVFKNHFGSLKIEINQKGQVNIIGQTGEKSISNISAPKVEKVSHENVGEVTYGIKIQNQSITDKSATYDVDRKDYYLTEKASIFFINKIGEKRLTIIGIVSLISGLITIFGWYYAFINNFLVSLTKEYSSIIISIGIFLLILGMFFIYLILYKKQSQCSKCEKYYAMEEIGDPKVKEVKTADGIRRTTYRTYKCKYCGFEESDKENELIPFEKIPYENQ